VELLRWKGARSPQWSSEQVPRQLSIEACCPTSWGDNGASVEGGAIYNQGTLNLNAVTVQQCYATDGGALYNQGAAKLNSVTVQNNDGIGALFNTGTLDLTNSTVQANLREGIINSGTADLNGVTVKGNGNGGIESWGGSLTIEGGTKVLNNYASEEGAAWRCSPAR
jgi:hypothetical protein